MTAEAAAAAAQPAPAKSPPAMPQPHGSTAAAGTAAAVPGAHTRKDAHPMRDQPSLTDLVTRAGNGDTQARDALVEQYAALIWSICRRRQLADADAGRAAHSVWAQLPASWTRSRIRPRFPAGWPPPPAGNATASCAPRQDRTAQPMRQTPRSSRTITPRQPGRNCSRPSATWLCARRSRTCPPAASS